MLAFIIEELEDGRYAVRPLYPHPLAGVYVVERIKVHPLDVPFTVAKNDFGGAQVPRISSRQWIRMKASA